MKNSFYTSDEMLKYEKDNDLWWTKTNRLENRIDYVNNIVSTIWRYRKWYMAFGVATIVLNILLLIIVAIK